ncbi:MAG TPA: hypothetical protein VGU73_00240 [Acidimicrobiia bacterium]|nr:hypothetical protein [Acidimicrobiia bacterium]
MKRFSSVVRPEPEHVVQICEEVSDCLRAWGEEPEIVARTRTVASELLSRADPTRPMRFDLAHRPGRVDLRVTQTETVRRARATDAARIST